MHNFNWNYVWAALVINFLLVYLVPRLIKKPTKIQVVDDLVLFLNSQKGFLLASSIVVVIVVYGSHYWVASASEGGGHPETLDAGKEW
jgi:hypothetical protein